MVLAVYPIKAQRQDGVFDLFEELIDSLEKKQPNSSK